MRPIDADELLKKYEWLNWYSISNKGGLMKGATTEDNPLIHYYDGEKLIKNAPTLDVAPTVDAGPKWISVEDRLPDKQSDVLMLFKHNMAVGFWHDGDEDVMFWCAYTDDVFYTDCDEEPTHWMPLPQAPKGE